MYSVSDRLHLGKAAISIKYTATCKR